jgi:hypothetical protein
MAHVFCFLGCSRFGSIRFLSKKVTKPNFYFFIKKTETEPKPVQTDRFRFGSVRFFRAKTGLARFFRFGSGFFRFGFGSVFPVPGLKNQNRTEPVGFFNILIGLIGFFSRFGFFGYFFFWFSRFNQFFSFFEHPYQ